MAESLTLNLGESRKEGPARRAAYEKAKSKAAARSLNEWAKSVLDKAAGFKAEDK